MTPRAVVFDLWQTLARWPDEESRELRSRWSDSLGVSPERLDEMLVVAGIGIRRLVELQRRALEKRDERAFRL